MSRSLLFETWKRRISASFNGLSRLKTGCFKGIYGHFALCRRGLDRCKVLTGAGAEFVQQVIVPQRGGVLYP